MTKKRWGVSVVMEAGELPDIGVDNLLSHVVSGFVEMSPCVL